MPTTLCRAPLFTTDSVMAKATTISYEVDELSALRGMSQGAACDQLVLGIGNIGHVSGLACMVRGSREHVPQPKILGGTNHRAL